MQVQHQDIYDVKKSDLFDVLLDLESYPEFIDGVCEVSIVEKTADGITATFSLNWIKRVTYTIHLSKIDDDTISWSLVPGDSKIVKKNEGRWHLTPYQNDKTKVEYLLELEFIGIVPDKVLNKLTTYNLPRMIDSIVGRAKIRR